ncbi:glycosyl transferase [Bacillus sp. FJAT-25509]|uniref:glycosyltransferase family 4 protein n=1 Tax=Bacillaceae TaxID=186817 RepID=UPI0006FC568A|nr:glycosyltransferase family 1 protein [Bacillus sp. FJAT-25509]KQL37685.1 glycosyl transferase [Bacillus sp. FJAT-25509]
MRVAIFTDTFIPQVNGVAKTLNRFTNYLKDHGHSYHMFAPEDYGLSSTEDVTRLKSVPFKIYPECKISFPNLSKMKKTLKEFNPDIIHIATPFTIGLSGLHIAKKMKIPLVASYHTNFDHYLQYYNLTFLENILWKYLDWFHKPTQKIFVPSKDTFNHLVTKGFNNLSIWTHGVDCSIFRPTLNHSEIKQKYNITSKYTVCFVGRIAPEKDLETLSKIINYTKQRFNKNLTWLIVGDGPKKEEMIKKTGTDQIIYTGYLQKKDLVEIYGVSDLMVFPSDTETFGNVVLEAMACGTPVIGANAGGVKNIIRDYSTGVLCEPQNTSSFCQAIEDCLHGNEMLKHMSKKARDYALTQDWNSIFNKLVLEFELIFKPQSPILISKKA